MEWRFEIGICVASSEAMNRSDLQILRKSTKLAVKSFGWNLIDLKNAKTKEMFLEELNGIIGQQVVEDLRILHVSVSE